MAMYTVFGHPIYKYYKTSICSKATVFQCITTFFVILVPLIIAYRSEGFWKKVDIFIEQPDIRFKHQFLVIIETDKMFGAHIWGTFTNLNKIMKTHRRIASLSNREEDENGDGIFDSLHLSLQMPLEKDTSVHAVKLLLVFDLKLHTHQKVHMEGLAFIHYASPLPGASLSVTGELKFHQKAPLLHKGQDVSCNVTIIDSSSTSPEAYDLSQIFLSYSKRKFGTMLENIFPVWKPYRIADEPFKLEVNVIYPQQSMLYRPGFWQLIKWGWIQYLSIFLIFLYISHYVKVFVFNNQIINTVAQLPIKLHQL